jgi:Iron-binding zinc finger CDGSH type
LPAGRLVAWDKAADAPIDPELPLSIGLVEDPQEECGGPIWLRGGVPVVSADGFEYEVRNRVTLCRCGQSKNKPFCDGAHDTRQISQLLSPTSAGHAIVKLSSSSPPAPANAISFPRRVRRDFPHVRPGPIQSCS